MTIEFTSDDAFFPEDVRDDWKAYLRSYEKRMAPVFRSYGIDINVGLLAVLINQSIEAVYDVDEEPPEPWQEVDE